MSMRSPRCQAAPGASALAVEATLWVQIGMYWHKRCELVLANSHCVVPASLTGPQNARLGLNGARTGLPDSTGAIIRDEEGLRIKKKIKIDKDYKKLIKKIIIISILFNSI